MSRRRSQLPGIVVTTPSPVAKIGRRKPVRRPPRGTAETAADAPGWQHRSRTRSFPSPSSRSSEIVSTPGANLADSLQYEPGITGSNFAAGRQPAHHPRPRQLPRACAGERHRLARRLGAQRGPRGPHRSSLASTASRWCAGRRRCATARRRSAAWSTPSTTAFPRSFRRAGISIETRGGLNSVDRRRRRRLQGDGRLRQLRGACRRLQAPRRRLRHARRGGSSTPSSTARALRSAPRSSVKDGYIGIAFSRFNSLYGIPGEEALDERPRIDMQQDKIQSRGEWRVRDHGIEAIRFWFGSSDYAHNEIAFPEAEPARGRLALHQPADRGPRRGAASAGHDGASASCAAPSACSSGSKQTGGAELRRRRLLDPARTDSIGGVLVRGAAGHQAAAAAGRRAHRADHGRRHRAGLERSADHGRFAGERTFMPFSASAGILYELPLGVVARLTGQYVERAPADAELFSKGVHEATEHLRDRQSRSSPRRRHSTVRAGLQEGQRPVPLRRLGLLHAGSTASSSSSAPAWCATTRSTPACRLAPAPSSIRSCSSSATPPSTGRSCRASWTSRAIWRGVWGIDAQYDFVRASFDDAQGGNVPRIPPHRAGAGIYYRDVNWFARLGFLHAVRSEPDRRERDADRGLHAAQRRLWPTPSSSSGQGGRRSRDDHRPEGLKTCSTTMCATTCPFRRTRCSSPAAPSGSTAS